MNVLTARPPDTRGATVVVAASNSPDKSLAKYVCDGLNDRSLIQRALDEVQAMGGKVLLLAGDYYLNDPLRMYGYSQTLEGESKVTRLILMGGVNNDLIQVGAPEVTCGLIKIKDLLLFGNKAGQTTTSHGIETFGAENAIRKLYIEGVIIHDVRDEGIYATDAVNGLYLHDVEVFECGADGMWLEARIGHLVHVVTNLNGRWGAVLAGKTIVWVNGEAAANGREGVVFYNNHGATITGVNILGNGQAAADTYDGLLAYDTHDVLIEGCYFSQVIDYPDTQRYGIYIHPTTDRTRVVGNLIRDMLTGDIYDEGTDTRKDLPTGLLVPRRTVEVPEGRPKNVAPYTTIPGVEGISRTTIGVVMDRLYYEPIFVSSSITLDRIMIEVTTAGEAGAQVRLGIYNADKDWQPTELVLDAGTVSVDSTGVKAISIDQTLPPGRYLLCLVSNMTSELRMVKGGNRYAGYNPSLGDSTFVYTLYCSFVFDSFPAVGVPWDSVTFFTVPFQHVIFVRVSVP